MLAVFKLKELGDRTDDNQVEIINGQCNGACELAPLIWIEKQIEHKRDVVGKLSVARAIELARTISNGEYVEEGNETAF